MLHFTWCPLGPSFWGSHFVIMYQEVVRGDPFCFVFCLGPFVTLIRGDPFCNNVSGSGSGRPMLYYVLHGALWDPNSGKAIL